MGKNHYTSRWVSRVVKGAGFKVPCESFVGSNPTLTIASLARWHSVRFKIGSCGFEFYTYHRPISSWQSNRIHHVSSVG